MGGSSKGGRTTTTVQNQLDPRIVEGAVQTLGGALRSASLPYRANRGVTQAALSPQQMAAFEGANEAAFAFGLPTAMRSSYLPEPLMNSGGFFGYSPAASYDYNVAHSLSEEDIAARDALLHSYAEGAERVSPNADFMAARAALMGLPPPQLPPEAAVPAYVPTGNYEVDRWNDPNFRWSGGAG